MRPCPQLEAKLREVHVYQRELPVDPRELPHILESTGFSYRDVYDSMRANWELLAPAATSLPRELLEIFLLRYEDGLSVEEICLALDLSKSTVNRQLRKADAMVRRVLREREEDFRSLEQLVTSLS